MGKIKSDMAHTISVLYPWGNEDAEIGIVLMNDYTDSKERFIEELWVWQQAGYIYISNYTDNSWNDKGFILCTHDISIAETDIDYWASLAPSTRVELSIGKTATIYHGEVGE